MKKILLCLVLAALSVLNVSAGNDAIRIILDGEINYAPLTSIDSIYYDDAQKALYIQPVGEGTPVSFLTSKITEIRYLPESECPTKLKVAYSGNKVTVENPFFLNGVLVTTDGAYVTVNNTNVTTELSTELSGETTDGAFIYNGSYKTTIVLNGVAITSKQGAAVDIQCGKRVAIELKKETVSTLVDAAGGSQKAALYCKGHIEFDKSGTLNVTGNTKHAISAKEYIQLKKSTGTINILGAKGDGIHCGQYFLSGGFTVNISNIEGDGIQAELKSLDEGEVYDEDYENGSMLIKDGTFNISLKQDGGIETTSTGTQDTYSFTCLQADATLSILGGTLTLSNSGKGGKCIKTDGAMIIGNEDGTGPVINASTTGAKVSSTGTSTGGGGGWPGGGGRPGGGGGPGGQQSGLGSSSKAIKAIGQITVNGGNMVVTTATDGAEGLESKTSVTINGGNHFFKCYDDCINSSGIINFAGGNTVCYATKNDAVDSNYGRSGAITISGGNVFAYTTAGSPEEGLDCDNNSYIKITGGIAVSAGGSQGGGGWGGSSSSQSVGSSSQGYYLGSSPSSYGTSYYYTLCNTSGEAICTYKFAANVSNSLSLLTAPNLGKGSVTVKYSTSAPTDCSSSVKDISGNEVFFIAPTVTTTGTTATVTAK